MNDLDLSDLSKMQLTTCWSNSVNDAAHLANVHINKSLEYAKRLEETGGLRRLSLIRGPARPIENESPEELKASGLVGIYKQTVGG
jgi:hypothetical protein